MPSAPFGAQRLPVAILGATGTVGQTFIRLLADHPWFQIAAVAASERSVGQRYADVVKWHEGALPASVGDLIVQPCTPDAVREPIVFSALDSGPAETIEPAFAQAGAWVLSNAKTYRMAADVPLLLPEVNPEHLEVIATQRVIRGWPGAIITNANCAAIVFVMPLAPLHAAFGVRRLFVTTMQAVSGAGYPGVPSLDILGNVIPYIGGEEELKIETEGQKMLGRYRAGVIEHAPYTISSHANRVPVQHGHTVCMSIEFDERPTPEQALIVLRAWRGAVADLHLPSAPKAPLIVHDALDRPQPRRDVETDRGMPVHVGRVRPDPQMHLRLVAMGHNVVRGAAGASVLNAELLAARGLLRA
jgi:aspartate-semialdehyde dehydrogenase